MVNRKNAIIVGLALIFVFVAIFVFLKSEKEDMRIDKNKIETISEKKEKNKAVVEKREDDPKDVFRGDDEEMEDSLQFRVSSEEEIKNSAVQLVHILYDSYADMDFSQATPSEIVFVKNTKPGDKSPGHYVVVLRNPVDEIMARAVLIIAKEDEKNKILEAGNVEPFPPAFTDIQTQEEYRKAEKYPLTDPYPRISEDKAIEMARQRLGENFSFQGLTNIFISLPSLDNPYEIGVPFTPYYKFTVDGDEGKTIWIQSESGFIVDYPHLDLQVSEFQKMMEEERSKPIPSEENDEENND